MPVARLYMRKMVGHLVLDAESDALNKILDKAAESGEQLNLNLLGEAVLGEEEAKSRAERTLKLIQNPRVTYVSVKASSMVAQLNPWDIDGSVERLKERLRPLYQAAADRTDKVFINMDMEEYHDLHLTIRLFKELLSEPEFLTLDAGIVLQAYLPDTFDALKDVADFAKERVAKGGGKVKVRIVKGANLSMETVQGEVHDWPLATYTNKLDVDANYYRLLDFILREEYADSVRIGVATHNLYTAAMAYELGKKRGVLHMLDSEMLQGMSPAQQAAGEKAITLDRDVIAVFVFAGHARPVGAAGGKAFARHGEAALVIGAVVGGHGFWNLGGLQHGVNNAALAHARLLGRQLGAIGAIRIGAVVVAHRRRRERGLPASGRSGTATGHCSGRRECPDERGRHAGQPVRPAEARCRGRRGR